MLDQLLELSRKAAESSMQMQQVMFKHWTQNCVSASPGAVGVSADWGGSQRKRSVELIVEALSKQREAIDSAYRAGIQTIEQVSRVSEAKSAEECVRAVEEVWSKLFDGLKGQAEAQFQEFQKWAEKSFEMMRKVETE
jgi:hypothetical protein